MISKWKRKKGTRAISKSGSLWSHSAHTGSYYQHHYKKSYWVWGKKRCYDMHMCVVSIEVGVTRTQVDINYEW